MDFWLSHLSICASPTPNCPRPPVYGDKFLLFFLCRESNVVWYENEINVFGPPCFSWKKKKSFSFVPKLYPGTKSDSGLLFSPQCLIGSFMSLALSACTLLWWVKMGSCCWSRVKTTRTEKKRQHVSVVFHSCHWCHNDMKPSFTDTATLHVVRNLVSECLVPLWALWTVSPWLRHSATIVAALWSIVQPTASSESGRKQ